MTFMLIVGTLEEVVSNCLGGDSLAVWADWCLRMVYTKEVLVKWGVAGMKLCQ